MDRIGIGRDESHSPILTKARILREAQESNWRLALSRWVAVVDAVVLAATGVLSVGLKFGFSGASFRPTLSTFTYPTFAACLVVAWWLWLRQFHTRDPHIVGAGDLEYREIVRASVMMFGIVAILAVVFKWDTSRGFLAITFPMGLVGLLVGRRACRVWLTSRWRKGMRVSRVLVIGGEQAAQRLVEKLNGNPACGMRVTGVWVPDGTYERGARLGPRVPLIGADHRPLMAVRVANADTVIVTDSEHLGPEGMRELTWAIGPLDVELMVSPNLVDISAPRMHLGGVMDERFIHLQPPQYAQAGNTLKGLFDAVLGLGLLVLFSPLIVGFALTVKLTSVGPAFYLQTRIGRNGHPFRIIKLRSMRTDADELLADLLKEQGTSDTPLFKVEDDPRITPVGRFIRRYSIDELPQLINVVKGDMSLVGPRPQRDAEVEMYDHKAERRLMVRPGMTGLWQVSGRSDLTWEEAIRLDLYYVENWSMTSDLYIIWKTFRAVVGSDGAY